LSGTNAFMGRLKRDGREWFPRWSVWPGNLSPAGLKYGEMMLK
jgi:hypothetical protein